MQRLISKSRRLVALIAAVLALVAQPAQAATFSVDPISVTLPKGNASATIAITNQSPGKLRLQVSGFAWQQKSTGEIALTPSDDLVFFPQLLTLDPGETRRIRVGVSTTAAPVEKTYRVFMEELPSLESVVAPKTASVTIRMKVGVPVFLSPSAPPISSGDVRDANVRGGALSFDVLNTGNKHFSIQQVRVAGSNAAGGNVFSQDVTGWYVLAGDTRHFSLPISKERCEELRTVVVTVHTDALTFSKSFPDLRKQCAAGRS